MLKSFTHKQLWSSFCKQTPLWNILRALGLISIWTLSAVCIFQKYKRNTMFRFVSFRFVSFRSPDLFYLLTVGVEVVLFSLAHTQTHTTVGRTPLDEVSARRRDLYLTTQTLYKTNVHVTGGIWTHDPIKHSAADLRLRPRGHWDRPEYNIPKLSLLLSSATFTSRLTVFRDSGGNCEFP
jgi:hypothetical protein